MKQAPPKYLPASMLAWRAGDFILLAAIGGATALAGLLLSHPELSVFHKLVDIGLWLGGVAAKPEVVTWPAWGYAWVVVGLRDFDWIVVLQACLGVLSLAALARRLRVAMPRQATIIAISCVLAIPWHDMQVTLYPSGPAGSLVLLAFLSLDTALSKNDLKRAILAGVLVGFAQNLRTEFLLMPTFIAICMLALRRWRAVESFPVKPLWAFVLSALILQLPWALFYHSETGRYSLTESNLGHVMYVSLGSSPSNPWKIVGDDQGAARAVHEAGYPFSSLSEQGNQYLRRLVWEKVKLHPYGVVQRTFQQLLNTALAPFNWGEPKLDKAGALDIDVLRQELKARLGVGINVAKLNKFRSEDLYSRAKTDNAAKLALLYQVLAVGSGSVIFLLGILGIVLALMRAQSARLPLLLWFLAGAALYKIIQDVLLAYQVNYLNNVYPMFLPFVALSLTAIGDRLRGRTPVPPDRT